MALLSKKLAVASVGISCQTAHQIDSHARLIGDLAGAAMEPRATPFDWLLCPVASATRMIKSGEFFPGERMALTGDRKPYWPDMGVHFWHERFAEWTDFASKRAHLCDNWKRIADAERKIFIISNTQNNVTRALIEADREPIECRLIWDEVFRLFAALARTFGQVELHAVTSTPRHMRTTTVMLPWESGRAPITLHVVDRDRTAWEGDRGQWGALFRKIIQ